MGFFSIRCVCRGGGATYTGSVCLYILSVGEVYTFGGVVIVSIHLGALGLFLYILGVLGGVCTFVGGGVLRLF